MKKCQLPGHSSMLQSSRAAGMIISRLESQNDLSTTLCKLYTQYMSLVR